MTNNPHKVAGCNVEKYLLVRSILEIYDLNLEPKTDNFENLVIFLSTF